MNSNNKNTIKSVIDSLTSMSTGKNVDQATISKYNLSQESLGSTEVTKAQTDMDGVIKDINSVISGFAHPVSGESLDLTTAQKDAALLVAKIGVCSREDIYNSIGKYRSVNADSDVPVVNAGEFVHDVVDNMQLAREEYVGMLSREAFDGIKPHNPLYFSVAYNLLAARQDEFGEAFFPTIVIDPTQSGIVVENTYAALTDMINRTSRDDKSKYNKVPLIKVMFDSGVLSVNRNKCIPVYDAGRGEDDLFLKDFKYVNKETGTDIVTAPLAVGKTISILGISQTDEMLAKGQMDNTDALDRSISLRKVYFEIKTEQDNEVFSFDAGAFAYNNFTAARQGEAKDMTLSFETSGLDLHLGSITQANGNASQIFTKLNKPGLILKLSVDISGKANIEYSDVVIYGNDIQIKEIRTTDDVVLDANNADVLEVMQAIKSIKVIGYTLDAYRTNTNLRTMGQLLTIERKKQEYQINLRSGMSMLAPYVNDTGRENDVDYLNTQIQSTQLRTSTDAVVTLTRYAELLQATIKNGVAKDLPTTGVGRWSVHPYYKNVNFDVSKFVDSIKSVDRLDDIRAALLNKINDEVIQCDIISNYGAAHRVANNNIPTMKTVIIGTDYRIAAYLGGKENKIKLSNDVEAVIVSTYNNDIANKIFVTYGVFGDDRNTVVNPLNFGNMIWAPTIATDLVRTVGNSTRRELMTMPRYLHIVNLPILIQIDVSDIEAALKKVAINQQIVG